MSVGCCRSHHAASPHRHVLNMDEKRDKFTSCHRFKPTPPFFFKITCAFVTTVFIRNYCLFLCLYDQLCGLNSSQSWANVWSNSFYVEANVTHLITTRFPLTSSLSRVSFVERDMMAAQLFLVSCSRWMGFLRLSRWSVSAAKLRVTAVTLAHSREATDDTPLAADWLSQEKGNGPRLIGYWICLLIWRIHPAFLRQVCGLSARLWQHVPDPKQRVRIPMCDIRNTNIINLGDQWSHLWSWTFDKRLWKIMQHYWGNCMNQEIVFLLTLDFYFTPLWG